MKDKRFRRILGILCAVIIAFSGGFFFGVNNQPIVRTKAAAQKISSSKKTLYIGKSFKLKIKNAKGKYTWTSDSPSVAKVKTKSGKSTKVVAVSVGKAVITANKGKNVFKCTVTVKAKGKSSITPTPEPTPVPEYSVSTSSNTELNLPAGSSMQLKLQGKEAKRFYVHDSDASYITVTADGFVTAKNAVGKTVTIHIESKDYNNYRCKVNITEALTSSDNTTPIPTNTATPTPTIKPTASPAPTATPTLAPTSTPTKAPTPAPTAAPKPTGNNSNDLNSELYDLEKLSSTVDLGDTYGVLSSHKREKYQKTLEYSIEDERGFIKACRDALEHGVESFTITYRGFDCSHWWKIFCDKLKTQSELSGYTANGYTGSFDDKNRKITITPKYKDVWKAVTYLRFSEYETDDDIKKLLNAAISLVDEAIENVGKDPEAVLLYVNNRMCSMTTYTQPIPTEHDCPQRDATGVFFYGDGVCESYTAAMRLVLNVLGLENDTVVNKYGSHIWNRVKLNGTWYHIDVTWDDVEKYGGGFWNEYFMLTEAELIKKSGESDKPLEHSWYNFYF